MPDLSLLALNSSNVLFGFSNYPGGLTPVGELLIWMFAGLSNMPSGFIKPTFAELVPNGLAAFGSLLVITGCNWRVNEPSISLLNYPLELSGYMGLLSSNYVYTGEAKCKVLG